MSTDDEAQKAISEFHQFELQGRPLVVNEARPKPEFGGGGAGRGAYGGGGGYDGGGSGGGGSQIANVVPRPSSLVTWIRPCDRVTMA